MNKHTATFEGQLFTRNSKSRIYSHAVILVYPAGRTPVCYGWTAKPENARREASRIHGRRGAVVHLAPATVTPSAPRGGVRPGAGRPPRPTPPAAVVLLCAAGPTSCPNHVGCLDPTTGRLYCGPHALELGTAFRVLTSADIVTLCQGGTLVQPEAL
jgi:hypothetical protein